MGAKPESRLPESEAPAIRVFVEGRQTMEKRGPDPGFLSQARSDARM